MAWLSCASEENAYMCPWCGSEKAPVINARAGSDYWRKLNPVACPDCSGSGNLPMWLGLDLARAS